jgi:heme oxygenase (biliverdin-IX-beta and delta-forming)
MSHLFTVQSVKGRRMTDSIFREEASSIVRWRLRTATASVHERMHAHAGFKAASAGTIHPIDYRRLLVRLYGFYKPFEEFARAATERFSIDLDMSVRARAPLLLADLRAIGSDPDANGLISFWRPSICLLSKGSLLGALYVVEGATLGGVGIARALKDRASYTDKARSFFAGRRERHGVVWHQFLERLELLSENYAAISDAERAALETFAAFESWMADW